MKLKKIVAIYNQPQILIKTKTKSQRSHRRKRNFLGNKIKANKISVKEGTIDGELKKLMWVSRRVSSTNSFTRNNS